MVISTLPGLSVVLLQHRLHGLQLAKVLAHVRMQHHFDDEVPELAKVALLHIAEHVAVLFLNRPEEGRHVVVLQHGPVVVEQRQFRARVDVKVIGRARVVEVVNDGCQERGEDLEVGEPAL